jgi:hypothetical protein
MSALATNGAHVSFAVSLLAIHYAVFHSVFQGATTLNTYALSACSKSESQVYDAQIAL